MAFVNRKVPLFVLAAVTSLGLLAPHAAEARNGQNAALIAGALLGVAAGSALAQQPGQSDDGYAYAEPAPRPIYVEPAYQPRRYEDDGFEADYRPRYRDDAPRYRVIDDGWSRHYAGRDRGFGERPCPDRRWSRFSED